MDKFTTIMLIYLLLIIVTAIVGYYMTGKTLKGMVIGTIVGLVITIALYITVGKKYIAQ